MFRFAALRPAFALAVLFAMSIAAALAVAPAVAQSREVLHYQKNMMYNNKDDAALAGDIVARAPDTISLQEVSPKNRKILKWLELSYPSQQFCKFKNIGGVAVLSRWPMIQGTGQCLRGQGIAAIQVMMPEGPVWVMSVHLETPEKPLHGRMVQALAPELRGFQGPKIVAGDFNAGWGSASVDTIAQAAGVSELGPRVTTYRLGGFLGLSIDHVLATGGRGQIQQLPLIGSDHYGVLARINLQF